MTAHVLTLFLVEVGREAQWAPGLLREAEGHVALEGFEHLSGNCLLCVPAASLRGQSRSLPSPSEAGHGVFRAPLWGVSG